MAYLCQIHRPSSVRTAIKLNLLAPGEECLVLAKSNRLEIWTHSPHVDGLVMAHSKVVYGRISMLRELVAPESGCRERAATDTPATGVPPAQHNLFVGTDRAQYFVLRWDAAARQLVTVQSFVDVSDPSMRDSPSPDRCLADPRGQHLVLQLHEGVLTLIDVLRPRKGVDEYLDKPHQVRIAELKIASSAMLYAPAKRPKIALLYRDVRGARKLVSYPLTDEKGGYAQFDAKKDADHHIVDLDPGASMIIPVPRPEDTPDAGGPDDPVLPGLIVVGETKMMYLDTTNNATVEIDLDEANYFVAWERIDAYRYILADDFGHLHLLELTTDASLVTGFRMKQLGRASKPQVLVYLGYDILYIGSHEGDCQVVRLQLDQPPNECVQVVQTMPNIAPILDFTIMDMGNRGSAHTSEFASGQARLVTGSGVFQDGSLRSVRSGVGLEDIGVLGEMENIRGVFSLKSHNAPQVDSLLVSFPTETRAFRFDEQGAIEEAESFGGFALDETTLLAANVSSGRLLQVTTSGVLLADAESGMSMSTWKPPEGQTITAVSANTDSVLLSVDGVSLISLDAKDDLKEIARQDLGDSDQVSCVHVPCMLPGIGLVGFWRSGTISIVDLASLKVIHGEAVRSANSAAIPRNMVLAQLLPEDISGPTLFVAMADGMVLSFDVDKTNFSLSSKKSIVLGSQEATFKVLPRSEPGVFNVFAACDNPSLIYGSDSRIVYSAVTAEKTSYICDFDSEAYPGSVVVATESDVRISMIDTERRTHVQTLPTHETVRRIAYSAEERVFGIGSVSRRLSDVEEIVSSSFRLVDEINFADIGKTIDLASTQGDEIYGQELIETVIRAEVRDHNGDAAERFIVGTSMLEDALGSEEPRGRILVFGVDSERSPYLVSSRTVRGACRCLAMLDGKIVAALVQSVVIYDYEETSRTSGKFTKLAGYRSSTCPIDLAVHDHTIAVGDLMKSVSLVEFTPGERGESARLAEVARHFQSCSTTAVAHLGGNSYLEADDWGNLRILRRNVDSAVEDDKKRLEVTSELNLGEMVNRIHPITVDVSADAVVVPKAFLATASLSSPPTHANMLQTEGSIHLLAVISPSYLDLLMRLQSRLADSALVHALGNLPFASYRAMRSADRRADEPFRFVDGELIERFLDLREADQAAVCDGLGPSVEDVRSLVENLRRLA